MLVCYGHPDAPLENGDRLTREEFEQRYEAMPDVKKFVARLGDAHDPYQ